MNIAAEFSAAIPKPQVILGLRLKPLSLGRYRLLKRFKSPFVEEDEVAMPLNKLVHEFLFALVICGLSCEEFRCLYETEGNRKMPWSNSLKNECARLGKQIRRCARKEKAFNIFAKIEAFKRFLAEATTMPWHALPRQGAAQVSVSHWSHAIEMVLRSRLGWTAEEVDEEPLSKAFVDFYKLMESDGAVTLLTHAAYEELSKHAEANAKAFLDHFKWLEEQAAKEGN